MKLVFDDRICVARIYSNALENLMKPISDEKIDLFSDFVFQCRTGMTDSFVRYWDSNCWADRILRKSAPNLFKDLRNTIDVVLYEQLYRQITTFITDKLHSALAFPMIPYKVIESVQQYANDHNYKSIIVIEPKEWLSIASIRELVESITVDLKREITTFINTEQFVFQCKQTVHGIGVIDADIPLQQLCDVIPSTTRFFIRQQYISDSLKEVSLVYCDKNDSIGASYRNILKQRDGNIPLYWNGTEKVNDKVFELFHFKHNNIDSATTELIRLVERFIEKGQSIVEIAFSLENQVKEYKISSSMIVVPSD